jgi:hypothetical protein
MDQVREVITLYTVDLRNLTGMLAELQALRI